MALLVLGVVVASLAALFLIPGSTPRIDTRRHAHSLTIEELPMRDPKSGTFRHVGAEKRTNQ
jgi:hypothetical protein